MLGLLDFLIKNNGKADFILPYFTCTFTIVPATSASASFRRPALPLNSKCVCVCVCARFHILWNGQYEISFTSFSNALAQFFHPAFCHIELDISLAESCVELLESLMMLLLLPLLPLPLLVERRDGKLRL